jgi:hypothetical protein
MAVAFLPRNPATARTIEAILGLPGPNWSDVQVEFGLDETATAKVTLLISKEQLHQLVAASVDMGGGS